MPWSIKDKVLVEFTRENFVRKNSEKASDKR